MYCGLRFSARSIVGTIDLYNIGVAVISYFYKLLEKMFLKDFRNLKNIIVIRLMDLVAFIRLIFLVSEESLKMLPYKNLKKKEQSIFVKNHESLPV
jgi:hypothetical protein